MSESHEESIQLLESCTGSGNEFEVTDLQTAFPVSQPCKSMSSLIVIKYATTVFIPSRLAKYVCIRAEALKDPLVSVRIIFLNYTSQQIF